MLIAKKEEEYKIESDIERIKKHMVTKDKLIEKYKKELYLIKTNDVSNEETKNDFIKRIERLETTQARLNKLIIKHTSELENVTLVPSLYRKKGMSLEEYVNFSLDRITDSISTLRRRYKHFSSASLEFMLYITAIIRFYNENIDNVDCEVINDTTLKAILVKDPGQNIIDITYAQYYKATAFCKRMYEYAKELGISENIYIKGAKPYLHKFDGKLIEILEYLAQDNMRPRVEEEIIKASELIKDLKVCFELGKNVKVLPFICESLGKYSSNLIHEICNLKENIMNHTDRRERRDDYARFGNYLIRNGFICTNIYGNVIPTNKESK